ncbi:hypothetical protein DTL21_04890 [Bremerella cremea]|uniref:Protein MtfA n=1 Tax=Blastopirellula marina TaxID=124 RepID=A0A2S8FYK4_9BACT|nr:MULTISPECIES: M90 family metallopeptidase [Pirellulaceae]PQO37286.1 hypothetical protein C5Y83_04890 [Blastopirellula marina]RCS49673.1 hypothetical protein DTL21_04890 [Bremerella cremea]
MIFKWLKNRRRRRIREEAFPTTWLEILEGNVAFYHFLTETQQKKLRADIQVFVAEKNWEGCGGLTMTDEVRVTVAALACILTLSFKDNYYDLVQSVLVYPDAYVAPNQTITKGGIVFEGESNREGEAWYRGPVILSWADAQAGARGESGGHNLVFHEFAHQLDMQNGRDVDGTPVLPSTERYQQWGQVIPREFQQLQMQCSHGMPTLLDCYGATNISEFFAVATECFFVQPRAMQQHHAELYQQFRNFYQQDPANWR